MNLNLLCATDARRAQDTGVHAKKGKWPPNWFSIPSPAFPPMSNRGLQFIGFWFEVSWVILFLRILYTCRAVYKDRFEYISVAYTPLKFSLLVWLLAWAFWMLVIGEIWWFADATSQTLSMVTTFFVDGLSRPIALSFLSILWWQALDTHVQDDPLPEGGVATGDPPQPHPPPPGSQEGVEGQHRHIRRGEYRRSHSASITSNCSSDSTGGGGGRGGATLGNIARRNGPGAVVAGAAANPAAHVAVSGESDADSSPNLRSLSRKRHAAQQQHHHAATSLAAQRSGGAAATAPLVSTVTAQRRRAGSESEDPRESFGGGSDVELGIVPPFISAGAHHHAPSTDDDEPRRGAPTSSSSGATSTTAASPAAGGGTAASLAAWALEYILMTRDFFAGDTSPPSNDKSRPPWEVSARWRLVVSTRWVVLSAMAYVSITIALLVWQAASSSEFTQCAIISAPESTACFLTIAPNHVAVVRPRVFTVMVLIAHATLFCSFVVTGLSFHDRVGHAASRQQFSRTLLKVVALEGVSLLCIWCRIFDRVRFHPALAFFVFVDDVASQALIWTIVLHLRTASDRPSTGTVAQFFRRARTVMSETCSPALVVITNWLDAALSRFRAWWSSFAAERFSFLGSRHRRSSLSSQPASEAQLSSAVHSGSAMSDVRTLVGPDASRFTENYLNSRGQLPPPPPPPPGVSLLPDSFPLPSHLAAPSEPPHADTSNGDYVEVGPDTRPPSPT